MSNDQALSAVEEITGLAGPHMDVVSKSMDRWRRDLLAPRAATLEAEFIAGIAKIDADLIGDDLVLEASWDWADRLGDWEEERERAIVQLLDFIPEDTWAVAAVVGLRREIAERALRCYHEVGVGLAGSLTEAVNIELVRRRTGASVH